MAPRKPSDHEERVGTLLRHRRDGVVDIFALLHPQGLYGYTQHRCCSLDLAKDVCHDCIARIPQHRQRQHFPSLGARAPAREGTSSASLWTGTYRGRGWPGRRSGFRARRVSAPRRCSDTCRRPSIICWPSCTSMPRRCSSQEGKDIDDAIAANDGGASRRALHDHSACVAPFIRRPACSARRLMRSR